MKNEKDEIPCPCSSGNTYENCCKPFHQGLLPKTAVQLMRSRYSAYALCLPDYIIRTTHPNNPHFNHNAKLWTKQITDFCLNTEFKKLDVLHLEEKDPFATVTFFAYLSQNGKDASYKEQSYFEKVKGKWLYLIGNHE